MVDTQEMLQISARLCSKAVPDQVDLAMLVPSSWYTIRKCKHLAVAYLSEQPGLVCFLMSVFFHEVLRPINCFDQIRTSIRFGQACSLPNGIDSNQLLIKLTCSVMNPSDR